MPRQIDHERVLTALGILTVLVLVYSVLVLQQILLGLFVVLGVAMVYLFCVFIQVLDRIATALERLADQRRHE
jgi:hypothetical protein